MYFKVLAHLHCPSGASLSLRSLSHSLLLLQPSFGQLPVSFAPLHSLRPSFRYHYTTFVPMQMLHFMASHQQAHKSQHKAGSTFHFAKPTLQYSLGFIIATLRPAFISVGLRTPAANNFCVPCLPAPATCLSWFLTHTTKAWRKSKTHAKHLRKTFLPTALRAL
jgi:hypothetical protein